LNLYKSITPCALCHELSITDTMINTKLGKICVRCDIQMNKLKEIKDKKKKNNN